VKRDKSGEKYELTFPEATYHISRTQWEWAIKNNLREEDSFLEENIHPIGKSGHLSSCGERGGIVPGFFRNDLFGHTPGMMIPFIKYKEKTLVYTGI